MFLNALLADSHSSTMQRQVPLQAGLKWELSVMAGLLK